MAKKWKNKQTFKTTPKVESEDNIWVNRDDLHFTWDDLLSHNKTWNFAVSQREAGKSVDSWRLLYNAFYYAGCPSLVLRRRIADMTSAYIDDVASLLNKFLKPEHQIQLLYLKGDVSSGIADVKVGKADEKYSYQALKNLPTFFRIIGLSTPMNRIKSLMLKDVRYMFFDEFIANTRGSEKYLQADEHFLIKEIYTTYNREAKRPIKILCSGNPYSVYSPLFTGLEVDSSKLKPGAFVVKDDYAISCYQVSERLRQYILKNNPMYEFDDTYKRYAFGGEAINDSNIRIHKTEPRGFKLKWVFKLGKDFISIHAGRNTDFDEPFKFWVCKHTSDWLSKVSKRRKIVVFSYGDLIQGAVKWTPSQFQEFKTLRNAMAKREVVFNCIDASYMLEDVEVYL